MYLMGILFKEAGIGWFGKDLPTTDLVRRAEKQVRKA
jgi:hypothetical protein